MCSILLLSPTWPTPAPHIETLCWEAQVVPLIMRTVYCEALQNIYFELTEAFNAHGPTVALASGQAVVFYRIAIMSKDGGTRYNGCKC